ncbi:hypothetical protein CW304_08690 [Bacillus sp. UFRGS-B20]|nr:hypothetical protein CW304_08690 [Bacillus sp. UFRGS-B20]
MTDLIFLRILGSSILAIAASIFDYFINNKGVNEYNVSIIQLSLRVHIWSTLNPITILALDAEAKNEYQKSVIALQPSVNILTLRFTINFTSAAACGLQQKLVRLLFNVC